MPITPATTTVYVRVDSASRRIIGLSDVMLPAIAGKPVFTLSENDANILHYVVETDGGAEHGFTVRVATAEEIVAIDGDETDRVAAALSAAKYTKAFAIKEFFDEEFIRRFRSKGFMTTTETLAAEAYAGTDTNMVDNIKPLAIMTNTMYCEWRFNTIQPAIDAMLAADGLGDEIDEAYRTAVNDDLDQFLADRGLDILVYHR